MSVKLSGRFARALGCFGAALFIGVSAATNVSHGYSLGLARSELAAVVFAAGSLAGAIMAPVSFLAARNAFRNWRFGTGLVAFVLGCCCLIYASTSSLGFVGTTRDTATATRAADADAYQIAKASAEAAAEELKTLAAAPRGNRKTEERRADRRSELETTLRDAQTVMSVRAGTIAADPVAEALASYAGAAGWEVDAAKLSPWLVLLAVLFFEVGAAASLIVVSALVSPASPEQSAAPAKAKGRKRSTPLEDVMARLRGVGGRIEGSYVELAAKLGLSKSAAHRALHALAGMGAVSLATSAAGTLVQLRA
ncbi:helix-turn-helix domain-containing protein [Hyphomicrobium sp.]|uniref:helix-turn-helix domain-containing protein n=1 Tax=Hyphomicrobium sp. TaxID=82 RepID=UPI002D10CFD0|nr:helix-turn-helix domain-containing protein [Hyphomicrobium sp.]HRQ25649.1 helix-turn-helix domain-containing protein [Hyphomicrobium sp.]